MRKVKGFAIIDLSKEDQKHVAEAIYGGQIPDVKLGPDINWLVRAGVDPVAFIRQFGKQIVFIHLRDQRADGRWPKALGEGVTDFVGLGKVLHDTGFRGDLVIEFAHENDFKPARPLRESLKISRTFFRQTLGC